MASVFRRSSFVSVENNMQCTNRLRNAKSVCLNDLHKLTVLLRRHAKLRKKTSTKIKKMSIL